MPSRVPNPSCRSDQLTLAERGDRAPSCPLGIASGNGVSRQLIRSPLRELEAAP
jgi:hypothetical protein